jgi:hypothetical protein
MNYLDTIKIKILRTKDKKRLYFKYFSFSCLIIKDYSKDKKDKNTIK